LNATPLERVTIAWGEDDLLPAGITARPVIVIVSISSKSDTPSCCNDEVEDLEEAREAIDDVAEAQTLCTVL
jgi:hypothetical protein